MKRKESRSRFEPRSLCLPASRLTARPNRLISQNKFSKGVCRLFPALLCLHTDHELTQKWKIVALRLSIILGLLFFSPPVLEMRRKIWADVELVTSDACTSGDDVQRQFRESLPPGKKRLVSFVLPIGWLWVRRLSNYCFLFFVFCCCFLCSIKCSVASFFSISSTAKGPFFYPSVNRQLFHDLLFIGR